MLTYRAERITYGPGQDQLLYFTTSSLDTADEHLWYIRDLDGSPNIHCLDFLTGTDRQLTHNRHGRMWQYQGFNGERGRGLAVWSVALDSRQGTIYCIQDNLLLRIEADGATRELSVMPPGQTVAFVAVSHCGRWLCVPTTDERAMLALELNRGAVGIRETADRRCQAEGLNSFLRVYDTDSGALAECVAVPRCWITHVQFRPDRPDMILYNHEWADQAGMRRMWLWDGHRHQCLRPASQEHHPDDWVCHEVWSGNGCHIIYHGQRVNGPAFIGRRDIATGRLLEIDLPPEWRRYGHFHVAHHRNDLLVSDGYFETPEDPPGKFGVWIALLQTDWEGGRIQWQPLCRHRSLWQSQDDHPHPIFDWSGRYVYFTGSDGAGGRSVYRVAVSAPATP